jgi:hypothetical protein
MISLVVNSLRFKIQGRDKRVFNSIEKAMMVC